MAQIDDEKARRRRILAWELPALLPVDSRCGGASGPWRASMLLFPRPQERSMRPELRDGLLCEGSTPLRRVLLCLCPAALPWLSPGLDARRRHCREAEASQHPHHVHRVRCPHTPRNPCSVLVLTRTAHPTHPQPSTGPTTNHLASSTTTMLRLAIVTRPVARAVAARSTPAVASRTNNLAARAFSTRAGTWLCVCTYHTPTNRSRRTPNLTNRPNSYHSLARRRQQQGWDAGHGGPPGHGRGGRRPLAGVGRHVCGPFLPGPVLPPLLCAPQRGRGGRNGRREPHGAGR